MSLWNWIKTQVTGVDIEKEVAIGQQQDALIAEYQARQYADGIWTASEYDAAKVRAAEQAATTYKAQVQAEFDKGLKEGKANVSGAIGSTINAAASPFTAILSGIPAWLWLVAAGIIAFKLGLLDGLFRKRA